MGGERAHRQKMWTGRHVDRRRGTTRWYCEPCKFWTRKHTCEHCGRGRDHYE